MTSDTLSGKKALVIGGTGGIGRAVAMGLAEKGVDLTIHGGSSQKRLEETLNQLKIIAKTGQNAKAFLLAVEKTGAAGEIIRSFMELNDQSVPDILVCAWGPFRRGPLEALDSEFWHYMVAGNLIFPGELISLVLPGMLSKKWGRILLFGGTNTDTIRGYSTSAAYSAAKTGLGVIAKSLARTAGQSNITCNVLCPGLTDTEYLDKNDLQYNREKSPGKRALAPEDIAAVSIDILENPCINGAIIPVDKGICL